MSKVKKGYLVGLLLSACVCLSAAFQTAFHKADAVEITTFVTNGAYVRIGENNSTSVDDNGIRFPVLMDTASFAKISENGVVKTGYETGVLVMPSDLLTGELTVNTEGAKKEVTNAKWWKQKYAAPNSDGVYVDDENGTEYMTSAAYVYNIPEGSYNRPYTFRGYVKDTSTGAVTYTSKAIERSMAQISLAYVGSYEVLNDYLLNYNVNFVDNEGNDINEAVGGAMQVKYGSAVSTAGDLPTYSKDGYTFNGWRTNGQYETWTMDGTQKILHHTTYQASLTPNTFSNKGAYANKEARGVQYVAPTLSVVTSGSDTVNNGTHSFDVAQIEERTNDAHGNILVGTVRKNKAIRLAFDGGYATTDVVSVKVGYRIVGGSTVGNLNFGIDGAYKGYLTVSSAYVGEDTDWLEYSIDAATKTDGELNSIEFYSTGEGHQFVVEIGYVVFAKKGDSSVFKSVISASDVYYTAPDATVAAAGSSITSGASITTLGGEWVEDADTADGWAFKVSGALSTKAPYFVYDSVDMSNVKNIHIRYKFSAKYGVNIDCNNKYTKWNDAVDANTWTTVTITSNNYSEKHTTNPLTSIDFRVSNGSGGACDVYIDYILFEMNGIEPFTGNSIDFSTNNELLAKHFTWSSTTYEKTVADGALSMQLTGNTNLIELYLGGRTLEDATITIVADFGAATDSQSGQLQGGGIYANDTSKYLKGFANQDGDQTLSFTYSGTLDKLIIKNYGPNNTRTIKIKSITITQGA